MSGNLQPLRNSIDPEMLKDNQVGNQLALSSCEIAAIIEHFWGDDLNRKPDVIITVEGGVADVYHRRDGIYVLIVDFDNGDELPEDIE